MKLLIQRVSEASVTVESKTVASISKGVLILVGFDPLDSIEDINKLTKKLLSFKIFNDDRGRVGLSILEEKAEILIVPQVTLSVNTGKGNKPSFSQAAGPQKGLKLFNLFKDHIKDSYREAEAGIFGANMSVKLVNEGPITYWFES